MHRLLKIHLALVFAAVTTVVPAMARGEEVGRRAAMLDLMLGSSLRLSRTGAVGTRGPQVPRRTRTRDIPAHAERNAREAAEYLLDNAEQLPLDRETARALNRILTRDLVKERVRGRPDYWRSSRAFYQWLGSDEARQLALRDPVGLAFQVHRRISLDDAFPDGNGRTARLMADLVLIKSSLAPAHHTDMQAYFERGVPVGARGVRQPPSLATQEAYFRQVARAGSAELQRRGVRVTGRPIDIRTAWPARARGIGLVRGGSAAGAALRRASWRLFGRGRTRTARPVRPAARR